MSDNKSDTFNQELYNQELYGQKQPLNEARQSENIGSQIDYTDENYVDDMNNIQ